MFFLSELSLLQKLTYVDSKDVLYNHRQRNSSCFGMKIYIIQLFTQGCPSTRDRSYLIKYILWRLIANIPAALHQYALALVSTGQCVAAMVHLNRAIIRGHLPSRALKAWLMIDGRAGVAEDHSRAYELVEEGDRLGCHHCQGVLALCYLRGYGIRPDEAQSLELARKSSEKSSRYGQHVLGWLYWHGEGGVAQDDTQAVALYRLAAAQNFDGAQYSLGFMNHIGDGVAQDDTEALRWYQLAAAQGHPDALVEVAFLSRARSRRS